MEMKKENLKYKLNLKWNFKFENVNYIPEVIIMTGFIYMILCKENDKIYIGSTKRDFKSRKSEHFNLLRKGEHSNKELQEEFLLYGECKFESYPLEFIEIENITQLRKLEDKWINFYKMHHFRKLYNIEIQVSYTSINEKKEEKWHKSRKITIDECLDIKKLLLEGYTTGEIREMKGFKSNTIPCAIKFGRHWSSPMIGGCMEDWLQIKE